MSSRLAAGDQKALQELFHQHYPAVCSTVFRYIKDRAAVEDIAQQVFIKLWEKRQQIEVRTTFKGYLCRMAINEAIAHHRKYKKWQMDDEVDLSNLGALAHYEPEEKLQASELQALITQAINGLPPRCRLVFQLSRQEELSYKEIAEQLDISTKTVENQISKALRHLRQQLKAFICLLL